MPSPFPGMDPFLEAHWGDVHTTLAASIRSALRAQLPAGLVARIEERVLLEIVYEDEEGTLRESVYPDVGAFELPSSEYSPEASAASVAVATPLFMDTKYVLRTQRTVNIIETKGMRVITAIELLSPRNKIGSQNRAAYLTRQEMQLDAGVSLVEIDLIRQGKHVLYCPPIGRRGHYAISVVRSWKPTRAEVYPARFDAPLPVINVPLRERDTDAILDLQPLLERAYIDGDYHVLDYAEPLTPPFTVAENRWLRSRLDKRK